MVFSNTLVVKVACSWKKNVEGEEASDHDISDSSTKNEQSYVTNNKAVKEIEEYVTADTMRTYEMHVAEHNNLLSKVYIAI